MLNVGPVEVPPLRHSRLWSRVHRYLHPRIVARIKLPNVVQRLMLQRISGEHPQIAPLIRQHRMTESWQCLAQMIQRITDRLRIEQLRDDDALLVSQPYRTITATVVGIAQATTVHAIAYAPLYSLATVARTFFHLAVNAREAILANALIVCITPARWITRAVRTTTHSINSIESLISSALFVMNGQVARSSLHHPILGVFGTEHTQQLALLCVAY